MKLYLACEEMDSGGYIILATKATLPDIIEWFDKNPEQQRYGLVCVVEPETEACYFSLAPITVKVMRKVSTENGTVEVAGPMSVEQAMEFCRKAVSKFKHHTVHENEKFPYSFNTVGADTPSAWTQSKHPYTFYQLAPVTCKLAEGS